MVAFKVIWMIAVFLGATYLGGGTIGADYYDTEYYAQQELNQIQITNEPKIDTNECNLSGDISSWMIENCITTEDNK